MAAPGKAQLLNDVHALLKKRYKLGPRPDRLTVLEAVVYGICHEGSTREQANQALSRFKDEFFDWNEVRVSSVGEIQGVLAGLPDPEERAQRVRRFLRQLFEKSYGFTLELLVKKPLKDAVKSLQEYDAPKSDYIVASVIQQALGGHAIPVDGHLRRALERLGVADPGTASEALRGTLERAVPKNRGAEFGDLMEELAHDTCVPGEPDCARCELRTICPTGRARLAAGKGPAPAKPGPKDRSPKDQTPPTDRAPQPEAPPAKGKEKPAAPKDTPAARHPASRPEPASAPAKPAAPAPAPKASKAAPSAPQSAQSKAKPKAPEAPAKPPAATPKAGSPAANPGGPTRTPSKPAGPASKDRRKK
jgi:endonuclease-3